MQRSTTKILLGIIIGLELLIVLLLSLPTPASPVREISMKREISMNNVPTPVPVVVEAPPCKPTIDEKAIAERDATITRLEADVARVGTAHEHDAQVWKTRAEKLDQELNTLRQAVERAVSLEGSEWQAGRLVLAHALIGAKP